MNPAAIIGLCLIFSAGVMLGAGWVLTVGPLYVPRRRRSDSESES